MLRLRLQRRGKKNYATYRVVVADQTAPVKGKSVADLGSYNPHTDSFAVDAEAVQKWLAQGVQPSDTVHNLLVTHGMLKAEKIAKWHPKKKEAEETTEETASAEAPSPEVTQDASENTGDATTEA